MQKNVPDAHDEVEGEAAGVQSDKPLGQVHAGSNVFISKTNGVLFKSMD